jgi:predicted dehydrogenase
MFGPSRNDLLVFGDEGAIELTGEGLRLTSTKRGQGSGGARTQEVPAPQAKRRSADDSTLALYDDFVACVQTGKKPEAGADRSVAASRTCWLAELATARRAEVKWGDLA